MHGPVESSSDLYHNKTGKILSEQKNWNQQILQDYIKCLSHYEDAIGAEINYYSLMELFTDEYLLQRPTRLKGLEQWTTLFITVQLRVLAIPHDTWSIKLTKCTSLSYLTLHQRTDKQNSQQCQTSLP